MSAEQNVEKDERQEHGYGTTSDCLCGRNFPTVRGLREHLTKARLSCSPTRVERDQHDHHPNCYQSTGGIPEDLPADLCDCRVLRMIDAASRSTSATEATR